MKITAIVTTYDLIRLNDTIAAVDSLLAQTYSEIEILVVVDRNEALFLKLKKMLPPKVKIVLSNAGGLSNSRNTGVEFADGDIIAFMDDDAIADKNWLWHLAQAYKDPRVIGAGGKIKPLWLGNKHNIFPEELFWIIGCTYKGYPENKCAVRNNFGGNFSFRRDVFLKTLFCADVGRIGSLQLTSDDTEFSINALRKYPKSQIIYDPAAVVYHRIYPYRLSFRYIIQRAYGDGISKAFISIKHKGDALSAENTYLKGLVTESFPSEIKNMLLGKRKVVAFQKLALELTVLASFARGYLMGKMKWKNKTFVSA